MTQQEATDLEGDSLEEMERERLGAVSSSVCPVCRGVPAAPEVEGCHGCLECDFTGTIEGYNYMQKQWAEWYHAPREVPDCRDLAN